MLKYIMVTGNVIPSFERLPSKVQVHLKNQEYLENGENFYLPGEKVQIVGRRKSS